uniref:Serine-enriched protein-like n=1 Tax=Crassostrea virginica TaxID=6565 RepID=A0A8B8E9D9_CRAVI|nr:serine-enriched protein-like [Crassostrea virginica]
MSNFGSTTCLLTSSANMNEDYHNEGLSPGYDSNTELFVEMNRKMNFPLWDSWRNNDADLDSDSDISDVDSCISESESEDGAWRAEGAWLREEAWSEEDSSDSESEDDQDSIKYVNVEAVSEAMTLIVDRPDLCDVTFLVGRNSTPVHAIRSIMSTRSRIFFQLILKAVKEASCSNSKKSKFGKKKRAVVSKPLVHISEEGVENFKKLVTYVHTGRIDIHAHDVAELMCLAHRYDLPDLLEICRNFLDTCTSICAIHSVLDTAKNLQGQDIAQKIVHKMSNRLSALETKKRQLFRKESSFF